MHYKEEENSSDGYLTYMSGYELYTHHSKYPFVNYDKINIIRWR